MAAAWIERLDRSILLLRGLSLGATKFLVIFLLLGVWLILTIGFPWTTKRPSGFYPVDLAVWGFGSALLLVGPFQLACHRYQRKFLQVSPLTWRDKTDFLFYLLSFYLGLAMLGMCIPAYQKNSGQWEGILFFGGLGLVLLIRSIRAFFRHAPKS